MTPVVTAMVGKLLVSGSATEKINCLRPPPPAESSPSSRIPPTAVTANTSGGWTIGPNRLRLRTAQIAKTQLTA